MTHLLENYLYKIDSAFAEKEEKEILMIYVMIFAGLFALSYFLFWESSEKGFKTSHSKVIDIQGKIAVDQNYLNINPPAKITVIESQTETYKQQLAQSQEDNEYIKFQIEKISELYYDEQTWGEYINSISRHAKTDKIHLLELSNSIADSNQTFGHVLDISIRANASYKNLLTFINHLEQSFLVVDLHDMNVEATEVLTADLKISVWGISY